MVTLSGSAIGDRCGESGVEVHQVSRAGYFPVTTIAALVKVIKQNKPDVIQVHLSRDLWVAAAGVMVGGKVPVVFSQQMASSYLKRDVLHRWVWGHVSRVMALTEEIRNQVIRCTTIADDKVVVLPYGIDSDTFQPDSELRVGLRKEYEISDRQVVFGMVGRLDPGKGQGVFLEALSDFDDDRILGVLIGEETRGEPGYRKELEARVAALGLGNRVKFLGYIDDPNGCYPMLDVLVMPSRKETFGLVLIEAMSFGLPVIATNAGGVPEIVIDGKTGILVPPGDARALAGAMRTLFEDNELRQEMGHRGRERAIQHYRLDHHMAQLEMIFRQAAGELDGQH
jgi:glycosyltransferase involved in cell wall biosynthesis